MVQKCINLFLILFSCKEGETENSDLKKFKIDRIKRSSTNRYSHYSWWCYKKWKKKKQLEYWAPSPSFRPPTPKIDEWRGEKERISHNIARKKSVVLRYTFFVFTRGHPLLIITSNSYPSFPFATFLMNINKLFHRRNEKAKKKEKK